MPLRPLGHDLLRAQVSTKLSANPQTASRPDSCLLPEPDYFESIDQLLAWEGCQGTSQEGHGITQPSVDDMAGQSSKLADDSSPRAASKLLICHDFKGGYTEDPFERGYSFEFWHLADTFIYFSHKRITLPPRGWVDAGHRHGSKVLGTVIFEWVESKPDLEKCLYGQFPETATSSVYPAAETLPFSTVCASRLIRLAKDRNFDGYLINIETDLNFLPPAPYYPYVSQNDRDGDAALMEREKNLARLDALLSSRVRHGREQRMTQNATVLSSWVGWLREEGRRVVGPHWEVIWYDSVTAAGQLQWQDALTEANAPFFKNSDAIFTNYTWAHPPGPTPPGGLPESPRPSFEHHPSLLTSARMAISMGRSSADVYMGIDVFGRNCYGGYEVGRSLDFIFPTRNRHDKALDLSSPGMNDPDVQGDLGLSVALFAPGWTWEREKEDGGERSWSEWWKDELRFWFGKTTTAEGVYPISRYFGPRERHLWSLPSPSDPHLNFLSESMGRSIPVDGLLSKEGSTQREGIVPPIFYTNFNRGSGHSWWVYGRKVYDASSSAPDPLEKCGWTDIGSCFPKPDRIWPRLSPSYLDAQGTAKSTKSVRRLDKTSRGKWIVDTARLVDHDAWQGGSSLEVVFGLQQNTGPDEPTNAALAFLPLCTLNACHIAFYPLTVSLEIIVKPSATSAGSVDLDGLQIRPYLIWASDDLSEECSYHIPLPSSNISTFSELTDGWYSSKSTLHLSDMDAMQLASSGAVVPVVALGVYLPQSLPLHDVRILVGEVLLSARPPSQPAPVPMVTQVTPTTVTRPLTGTLRWERVPAPSGASPTSLWGILTWGTEGDLRIGNANDNLSSSGYFNIFASARNGEKESESHRYPDASRMWLGTSTYGLKFNSFVVAGLEPSDLILGVTTTKLTSITFGVHQVGVPEHATYGNTEAGVTWVKGMQELKVPLSL